TLKGNQSSKVVKGVEQIRQLPTLSLLHQNVGVDESKIISNPEQQDAANEKSDSLTSTLIPVDTSLDRLKISTLMSSNNLLDTHGPDMECSESATQLEELELAAVWHGAKVMVPLKFIVQDMDLVYHIPGVKEYILGYRFKKDVSFLEEVIVMKDVTH
ncbi:hypothetical protein Tco_1451727, partial [Tanacetum coccineum]